MHDEEGQDRGNGQPASEKAATSADISGGAAACEAVLFVCATCEAPLTEPLTRLPVVPEPPFFAWWDADEPGPSPATVPSGCYAIETEPYGAPLVATDVPGPAMPRRGTMDNADGQWLVSEGPRGNIVINPDDARGLTLQHASSACCGATPDGGMNQLCACGTLTSLNLAWVRHGQRLQP